MPNPTPHPPTPPSPLPEGHTTITPYLLVEGAEKAIALYAKALGAQTQGILMYPQSHKVMHAHLRIGNASLFISDVMPPAQQATTSNFYLYLDNVDAAFHQARAAGMKETHPLKDQFWGDRTGTLTDPFGIQWTLATHVKDVAPQDIERMAQAMGQAMTRKNHQAA